MGNTCRVGNIRPSQLLWTYGPGAMIDLPNFSVMTMGLDSWKQDQCHLIEEPRLLEQVRKMCALAGLKVTRLVRVSEGGLALGDLRPGCWRELSAEEKSRLFSQE